MATIYRCRRISILLVVSLNGKKTLFVTELSGDGDEGMRNWIKMADRALADQGHQTEVLRLEGDPRWSSLLPKTLRYIRRVAPDVLVYVPYSGLTSKSLLRHLTLRAAAAPRLDVLVTLQADSIVRRLPRNLAPTLGVYASERLRRAHREVAHDSCVLPPVVNSARFRPSNISRATIREELGLPNDKPIVLHVGHLRRSRGLEPLAELAAGGVVNVVLVASMVNAPDEEVEDRLRAADVLIKREFLPEIEHWYQAADVYVFPLTDLQGSIEIPLSVLEAMACGAPVATTPFGGLPSLFSSSESLRFSPAAQLAATAMEMIGVDGLPNRSAVAEMDDNAFGDAFKNAIQRAANYG